MAKQSTARSTRASLPRTAKGGKVSYTHPTFDDNGEVNGEAELVTAEIAKQPHSEDEEKQLGFDSDEDYAEGEVIEGSGDASSASNQPVPKARAKKSKKQPEGLKALRLAQSKALSFTLTTANIAAGFDDAPKRDQEFANQALANTETQAAPGPAEPPPPAPKPASKPKATPKISLGPARKRDRGLASLVPAEVESSAHLTNLSLFQAAADKLDWSKTAIAPHSMLPDDIQAILARDPVRTLRAQFKPNQEMAIIIYLGVPGRRAGKTQIWKRGAEIGGHEATQAQPMYTSEQFKKAVPILVNLMQRFPGECIGKQYAVIRQRLLRLAVASACYPDFPRIVPRAQKAREEDRIGKDTGPVYK